MVLESTMVCVDSSEYMRNGDYLPTRMQAQQDAVHMICHAKSRSNPENNLGLLTTSNSEVLVTLTADSAKVISHLTKVKPNGMSSFVTSLRIAQLALKHRQGKSHKTRVIIFCGSPITETENEIVKLAKRLKKEKVFVDVISFGEDTQNHEKLSAFMNAVNGKDGTSSNMVTISNGPMLSDALVTSPIILGTDKDGQAANFEFGFDPNEDPELALALRVSMEEQRNRKGPPTDSATTPPASAGGKLATPMETEEDAMLKQALGHGTSAASGGAGTTSSAATAEPETNLNEMTEEQQIAMAMRMSMAPPEKMDIDKKEPTASSPVVPEYSEQETDQAKKDVNKEEKNNTKEQDNDSDML